MKPPEFKRLFADVAKAHGFSAAQGGWYRELSVGLFILNLQKSNFGAYFELNLKLFLGRHAPSNSADFKRFVRTLAGDIFRRHPEEFRSAFDLSSCLLTAQRQEAISRMFCEFIDRIVLSCNNPTGILRLRDEGIFYLLPGVEIRLTAGQSSV